MSSLSPPWILFLDKGKPSKILPAMRPGEIADVSHLTKHAANEIGAQRYGDGSTPYVWAEVEMGEFGSPKNDGEGASVRRHYWKGIRLERYSGPAELATPRRPLLPSSGTGPSGSQGATEKK